MSHVTKAAGIEVFYDPRKWERSRGNTSFSKGSFPKIRFDPRALLNWLLVITWYRLVMDRRTDGQMALSTA